MSKTPRISPMQLAGRPGVLVQTPYDEFFVGQIKAMVPRGDRWFDPYRKGWWVAEAHAATIEHLVRECFGAVVIVDADGYAVTHECSGEKLVQESLL